MGVTARRAAHPARMEHCLRAPVSAAVCRLERWRSRRLCQCRHLRPARAWPEYRGRFLRTARPGLCGILCAGRVRLRACRVIPVEDPVVGAVPATELARPGQPGAVRRHPGCPATFLILGHAAPRRAYLRWLRVAVRRAHFAPPR